MDGAPGRWGLVMQILRLRRRMTKHLGRGGVRGFGGWCLRSPMRATSDLDVFVDFGGVDLDVDLSWRWGRSGEVAGDAVVEAHAEGEQEVGFLDGVVDPGLAVHAHHAERGGGGRRGWSRGRGGCWRWGCRGASAKARTSASAAGLGDAVAGEDDGFFGLLDEGDGVADGGGGRRGAWDGGGRGRGAAASKEKGAVACWASLVMSTRTGPGRPGWAIWKARRTVGRCLRRG